MKNGYVRIQVYAEDETLVVTGFFSSVELATEFVEKHLGSGSPSSQQSIPDTVGMLRES